MRRLVVGILTVAALVAAAALPALAASTRHTVFFHDTEAYSARVVPKTSHIWFSQDVEADIFFTFSNMEPCWLANPAGGGGGLSGNRVDVDLWREWPFQPDNKIGNTKTITCTGTVSWQQVNSGHYYFVYTIEQPWAGDYSYDIGGRFTFKHDGDDFWGPPCCTGGGKL